ncbi:hypothetical protein, partial [Klebsiella variicola]|uniref:hypothetical protein n=1 Tax=Klebsiella variicola TaxID=244366 RepID=UPI0031E38B48
MLNGKEIKCIKDMVLTGTPERPVYSGGNVTFHNPVAREGANKQVISSQADSLIKISRIWADFFPANTSNQPI